jgi:hypothetical protein
VISVIVYGRNDTHGYNLHRRAALSLNCIAELLDDPDDEIVFVDYNTPDELPTFVEALADTLTDRCLGLVRVLRVAAAIHERRFAARTHLPVIEPVARNAGVRRANPSNRWLLLTNTDMILLPQSNQSLSEICSELADAFYGLPRFELPEWLWEGLPRTDPRRSMSEIEWLGPGLRLDERTLSHEWIRFDAPGDFQLILRDDFLAVDGLDEEMLRGYHVDSNLSRRMLLRRGAIESLEEVLAGYHCNHNRERTVYHGTGKVTNDLDRFFFAIGHPELPAQRSTWGLADATLQEVAPRELSEQRLAATLLAAMPNRAGPRTASDAARVFLEPTYDSSHVLPFVADALAVSPRDAVIGYMGANPVLQGMLATVVAQHGFERPLEVVELGDPSSVDELAEAVDVFIVDLGLDASLVGASPARINGYEPAPVPARVVLAFAALERLVELERARLELGEHPRRIILVHSWTVFWDAYVLAHFDCSYTTPHSRVRRATVRPIPAADEMTRAALARERRLARWAVRDALGSGRLHLRPGAAVDLAELDDYRGFGDGWSYPDEGGIWTQGPRSELAVALEGIDEGDYLLALSLSGVCVGSEKPLKAQLLLNGEHVAPRAFHRDDPTDSWHVELPARVLADATLDASFSIEEPRSPVELGWSADDDRPLGIHIRAVALKKVDPALRLEETIIFAEGSGAERFLGEGWSELESAGVWTVGETASLIFRLTPPPRMDVTLVLGVTPFVTPGHPEVELEVSAFNERLADRVFRHGEAHRAFRVPLPAAAEDGRTVLDLRIRHPARPIDLGLSNDPRRLGVQLASLEVRTGGWRARIPEVISDASAKLRNLLMWIRATARA